MTTKTLLIAADHGGYGLKTLLIPYAESLGWQVVDLGTHNADRVDYPDFSNKLCADIVAGAAPVGVLICGTGLGMSIAANRHKGIRAALCHDVTTARLARAHNNANVLCLGGRVTGAEVAKDCLQTFLTTAFDGGRHQARLDQID